MNAISISNVAIRQTENQLYSLNDLHKAAGNKAEHQPNRWLRNQQTQELIAEIEAEGGKAYTTSQGGKNRGTFVCKELVYAYATWISAKFFLLVIRTFDRVANGYQITPKPTRALPDGLTGEQIEAVKKLHNALTKSAPKEAQARIAITLWSAVKSKFGCSYKEVPAEQFPEVLSVMSRVAVENGVLYGEVLDREPLPAPQPALLNGLDIERFAVTVYYGAWALEMLEEVALPLRQLGHPKATTMHTLWNESRSFLRHNIQALQRVLPALEPDHAAHVRGSLDRLQRLNARFI